jgi:hypothetical protein
LRSPWQVYSLSHSSTELADGQKHRNICVVIPLSGKAFHKFAVRGILSKNIDGLT